MKTQPKPQDTARPFAAGRWLALGFGTLLALLVVLGGWGTGTSISGAVIAAGRIEPAGHAQRVEHLHGGMVRRLLVEDGDQVQAGQVLLDLDDQDLQAEHNVLSARLAETTALRNRLEAETQGAATIAWDKSLRESPEPYARAAMQGQEKLFEARRKTRDGFVAQLKERIVQAERQVESLEAQARAVEKQRRFLAEEVQSFRTARQKNLATLQEITAREREMANLEGQTGDVRARTAAARSRKAEYELQILQLDAGRSEEAQLQARETEARENETGERLAQVSARLAGAQVRAPVSGEIFAMRVFSAGEVIGPGEEILSILPNDAKLILRAQVEPIHIDQVWRGQSATIIFPALAQRTTPAFEGTVTKVGADVLTDPRSGVSWYEVEVELEDAVPGTDAGASAGWISDAWKKATALLGLESAPDQAATQMPPQATTLALVPGMPAQAQLRTGERSPASYLLKPLSDYLTQALREE